jgi:hypothetical protein
MQDETISGRKLRHQKTVSVERVMVYRPFHHERELVTVAAPQEMPIIITRHQALGQGDSQQDETVKCAPFLHYDIASRDHDPDIGVEETTVCNNGANHRERRESNSEADYCILSLQSQRMHTCVLTVSVVTWPNPLTFVLFAL